MSKEKHVLVDVCDECPSRRCGKTV